MTTHPFPEFEVKIKASDPDVQRHISALKAENLKLHKQIPRCHAAQVTLNNRIVAPERKISENLPDLTR